MSVAQGNYIRSNKPTTAAPTLRKPRRLGELVATDLEAASYVALIAPQQAPL